MESLKKKPPAGLPPPAEDQCILLAHGGGGELTRRLLQQHILPKLANPLLDPLTDAAVLPAMHGQVCFSTDTFVVQPLFFPGGDIGRLAVCGTVNDVAVMGAEVQALSLGLVLEEGLPLSVLDKVMASIAAAAREAGVPIVTGDTKVVERRRGDGLIISTAGVGRRLDGVELGPWRIKAGDKVIVSGGLAEHGLAVMSAREGLGFDTSIKSDAAPLNGLVLAALGAGAGLKFMRDPTRGGLAGLLADLSEETGLGLEIEEDALPLTPAVRAASEMLGLDPLSIANEGKLVLVASPDSAERVLQLCHQHPLGRRAAVVGAFVEAAPPLVELITRAGGRRIVLRPYGEELPRIC
jgi:hydrogenase expression/formation protein HypE